MGDGFWTSLICINDECLSDRAYCCAEEESLDARRRQTGFDRCLVGVFDVRGGTASEENANAPGEAEGRWGQAQAPKFLTPLPRTSIPSSN